MMTLHMRMLSMRMLSMAVLMAVLHPPRGKVEDDDCKKRVQINGGKYSYEKKTEEAGKISRGGGLGRH